MGHKILTKPHVLFSLNVSVNDDVGTERVTGLGDAKAEHFSNFNIDNSKLCLHVDAIRTQINNRITAFESDVANPLQEVDIESKNIKWKIVGIYSSLNSNTSEVETDDSRTRKHV